ncbi:DUF5666 domain-containing protein [Shewanella corallii]|uniref:DUF5666 domain-containing protein n=1 Tax=Shewanella corallii TaxID=560080 RepID=A0ABT0N686_9GAMM|nr:DUF5666 domain-containing protein [Shewanella corallii]MCL2913909.1 DUF5666 domain-containing protein [Shewanella corallii]
MKSRLLLLPLVASLGACSGGHDEGPVNPPVPEAAPSLISGELTALNKDTGAATIGNHQLNLSNATISRSSDLSQLKVGMLLTVQANPEGVVSQIQFDDLLSAPVTSNKNGKLEVAGFEIVTTQDISKFTIGQMVEVSGYPLDGKSIQTTFIEIESDKDSAVEESEIEGAVTQLNDAKTEFMLGNVLVKVQHVDKSEQLKNGVWVEVDGTLDADKTADAWANLRIEQANVQVDTPDYTDVDGDIEISGRISWVAQDKSHMVVNQNLAVGILKSTDFDDDKTSADLIPGALVEVEGNWDTGAMRLNATEVEFEGSDDVPVELPEFEAQGYADYNADTGVMTMNAIPFYVSPRTQFEDSLNKDRSFTNEWVEFSGYQQGNDYLVQEVESDEIDTSRVELEGKVVDGVGFSATLLGYQVINNQLAQYIGKQVEAECDRTPDNKLDNCSVEQDND